MRRSDTEKVLKAMADAHRSSLRLGATPYRRKPLTRWQAIREVVVTTWWEAAVPALATVLKVAAIVIIVRGVWEFTS